MAMGCSAAFEASDSLQTLDSHLLEPLLCQPLEFALVQLVILGDVPTIRFLTVLTPDGNQTLVLSSDQLAACWVVVPLDCC